MNCPQCGYCHHCGRGGGYQYWPYVQRPWITYTTGNQGLQGTGQGTYGQQDNPLCNHPVTTQTQEVEKP